MFGFSWGEIGIILAVALIAIGPKDLPVAIRTITGFIRKARGMAAEFQSHVDEMMREANVKDVVGDLKELRRAATLNIAGSPSAFEGGAARAASGAADEAQAGFKPPAEVEPAQDPDAPRFIPPETARRQPMPAFLPPHTRRWGF